MYNLKDNPGKFDWLVPKEGGIMWAEGLAITSNAKHPTQAQRFITWAQSPKAQALLATRRAYASNVPNKGAYALMNSKDRAILRGSTDEEVDSLLARLSVRSLPLRQTENE